MNENQPLESNERYLEASLHWLRLRLRRLGGVEVTPVPVVVPIQSPVSAGEPRRRFSLPWAREEVPPAPIATPVLLPPAARTEGLEGAASAREEAAAAEPTPDLLVLAEEFRLTDFERDILLLCAAVELNPAIGALIAKAQGRDGFELATFGLALALFDEPHWDALAPHRPLRRARLIEVSQPGATPLTASALRIDERILAYIKGANVLDNRLAPLLTEVVADSTALAPSQDEAGERILTTIHAALSGPNLPVVQMVGTDAGSKQAVAAAVSDTAGVRLFRLEAAGLPTNPNELDALARLWQRETFLLPIALYIDAEEIDSASSELQGALTRFLSRGPGLVFVGVREPLAKAGAETFDVEVAKPTAEEQRDAWAEMLEDENEAERLAGQFNLNLADLHRIGDDETEDTPWETCRRFTRPRLDALAQRIDAKATWDDLVLPAEQTLLMQQIVAQVRSRFQIYSDWGFSARMNRGLGVSALFAGESGTGKTMAAEVIANELGLDLYRIDLASVVSKYIGETEKNLRRLFDAAEQGGAILFFDEADALFGKRSEVKDSHDRYANIEINYLLQRMEAFSGLAILATNLKSAIDPAFMRRLRFVVTFPFPGLPERRRMWERALPQATPRQGLDYDRLARLSVTGANIQSIALNAAFLAADADGAVSMPLLMAAARTEFRKLEKPFTEAEFR